MSKYETTKSGLVKDTETGATGVFRTVGGRRIFIKDGQDLASAMKESGKFNNKKQDNIKDNDKQQEKVELEPKWCEVSESFTPKVRERIITQINELNKQFPEAFEQDHKLRISPTMEMGEKEFAYITDNGIMFLNKRYLDDLDNLSNIYQKSVQDNWNQKVPKGKELEGLVTHEFGHYYQNMQYEISDLSETMSKNQYAMKIQDDIHTDYVNKNGVKDINVSMYGFSSAREWYAEMFLQYHFYPDNEYAKNFYNKAIKGGK